QPLRSPDGTRVLSGTVKLWDAATGALIRTLEEHSDLVLSVSWTFICAPLLEEGSVRSRGHNGACTEDADRGTGRRHTPRYGCRSCWLVKARAERVVRAPRLGVFGRGLSRKISRQRSARWCQASEL